MPRAPNNGPKFNKEALKLIKITPKLRPFQLRRDQPNGPPNFLPK